MTKGRIVFIFIVLTLGFYFITTGFFGENGYFYNQTLSKLLTQREYQHDKISVELNSLIERQIQLASEQGKKDAALSLGYYTKGDNVYIFSTESSQQAVFAGNVWDTDIKLFNPLGKLMCLGISFIVSLFITFILAFASYLKNRDYSSDDSQEDEEFKV